MKNCALCEKPLEGGLVIDRRCLERQEATLRKLRVELQEAYTEIEGLRRRALAWEKVAKLLRGRLDRVVVAQDAPKAPRGAQD